MKRILISIVLCLVFVDITIAANEVKVPYASGQTLFFVIKNTSNQTWDPTNNNWETATGAITDYDIALTEDAVITGTYVGSIDTDITDAYDLIAVIYISGGTSPIGTQGIPWSGSAALNTSGSVQVGLTAQGFTSTLATNLGTTNTRVDTTVSSRSSHDAAAVVTAMGTGSTLTSLAPSATALSTATWTNTRAGYLDELGPTNMPADLDAVLADTSAVDTTTEFRTMATGADTPIAKETSVDDLETRLTAARAGYLDNINNASLATTVAQTGDAYSRIGLNGAGLTALGDSRLANLDATVSSRSSHTAANVVTALGTGSTLTAIPWNSSWDIEVQSEVADELANYDVPTYAELVARSLPTASYMQSTDTVDGTVTRADLEEMLVAFLSGKATITSSATSSVLSFYKQDGTSVKYTITSLNSNGSRANTGTVN